LAKFSAADGDEFDGDLLVQVIASILNLYTIASNLDLSALCHPDAVGNTDRTCEHEHSASLRTMVIVPLKFCALANRRFAFLTAASGPFWE
jgi:hypothetical protein